MNYLDFDLLIEKNATGYKAKVINSPAGQASQTFNLPFSALELENFVLRLGHLRQGMRRVESPGMEAAKEFGGKLFNALFADDVKSCWQNSLNDANRNQAGLRLRLRLSDTPELLDIPWEFLYYASLNRFLALSVETPLIRYLDLPGHITTLIVRSPLRVLVMIANPRDYPTLDVEREWQRLKEAVINLEQSGLLEIERLPLPTLGVLQRQLRQNEYHIFHFIGHGGYDERAQDGVLMLEDENGRSRLISGQDLGMILHDAKALRLALLNCCEGGRTSSTDPFAGVCQSLVQQGIPAVIAMQFAISDQAAITLSHEFYTALAEGLPVDTALAEARKRIFANSNDVEWGTPVLYMRTASGQIFDMDDRPTSKPTLAKEIHPVSRLLRTQARTWSFIFVGLVLLLVFINIWNRTSSVTDKPIDNLPQSETLTVISQPTNLSATPTTHSLKSAAIATQPPLPTNTDAAQPTLSPTLHGNIYTFNDLNNDGWILDSAWTVVPLDGGGGALQVTAPQSEWAASSLKNKGPLLSDMTLQVRFRILQAANRATGDTDLKLSVRASNDDPSGFESYSVHISSYLQNILLHRNARTLQVESVDLGQAGFAWQLDHWYIVSIQIKNSQISVSIDDKEWIATEDTVLNSGDFYLSAASGAQIQFDEIHVLP